MEIDEYLLQNRGNEMLNKEERNKLKNEYFENDMLFRCMYETLVYENYLCSTAASVIWRDALLVCRYLFQNTYPSRRIVLIRESLERLYLQTWYSTYVNDEDCAVDTIDRVFACVLAMVHITRDRQLDAVREVLSRNISNKLLNSTINSLKGLPKDTMTHNYLKGLSYNGQDAGVRLFVSDDNAEVVERETSSRNNGAQMKPVIAMMNRLWSKFRQSDLSRSDRAEFLSIISGWDKKTIYNSLEAEDGELPFKLSERQHGEDIQRINSLLLSIGVKREIVCKEDKS